MRTRTKPELKGNMCLFFPFVWAKLIQVQWQNRFQIFLSRFIMLRKVKSLMLTMFFTFFSRCVATSTQIHLQSIQRTMSCFPWGFNFEASLWQTYKRPICIFKVDQKAAQPHLVWNLALSRFPSARDVPPRTHRPLQIHKHTRTRFPRGWWISAAMLLCQPVIRLSMPAAIVHLAPDLSNPCQGVRTY